MSTVGENQLQRIIRDLRDAVTELCKEHCEMGEPITDDNPNLHKFCYKLEYLLQFDLKEKRSFLGGRKDYWDYFCACLAKIKGANDGIRFVKSIPELKTSLGKGRSFIRYGLVHQRLADTLQQCVMNYEITCDWYYERSPFLKSHLNIDIINHLYELNEVQFDVASRGYDLDSDWPTFARKTLGSAVSSAHVWKPPSRCSSVNSLASSFSQQTQELISGQDFSLPGDLGELGELSCTASEDVCFELDQSELKQKELLEKVRLLTSEAADLRAVVKNLEEQLSAAKSLNPEKGVPSAGAEQEAFRTVRECTDRLQTTTQELEALREQEASERSLEAKLNVAENRNMELLAKLEGALSEKEQQAASYCDSAWKIQELLTKVKEAERERIEYKRESEDRSRLAERLAQELKQQEVKLKEVEGKLDALNASADKERADELQMTVNRLQGALSLKERETGNLCTQLQDMQSKLEVQESQLEEMKKKTQEELTLKSELEERLKAKETELSVSLQKIQKVENDNQRLAAESQRLQTQAKKLEEYKNQCTSLMEINAKLIQTVKSNKESCKEPAHTKNTEPALESAENQHLEKCVPNSQVKNEKPENENEELGVAGKEKRTSKLDKLDEHAAVSQEHKKQSCSHLHDANECSTSKHKESTSRLALAEAQLDLNMKEVSRLHEEVLDLRVQLLVSSEERVKIQTLQEVTEASREDLRAQTEQLKTQVEELNRRHVEELMRCKEREENLIKERNKEAKAQTRLQTMVNTMREELDVMKKHNDTLTLENGEAREALSRANTETAELGVHVCMLTGQNEEAQLRWKDMSSKLQKVQTEAEMEVKTLRESMEAVSKDNTRLQEQLKQTEGLPKGMQELQERLERAEDETRSLQEIRQREVDMLRSQLSEEAAHHQNQVQHLNEELDEGKKKLDIELKKVLSLEVKALKLESVNSENSQMIEKKNNLLCDSETIIDQKEEQIKTLRENLSRAEEQLALAQQACHDLGVKLDKSVMENQTLELKTSAEIDDLSRTKRDLQERLIELIRDKDALWQKSDALEFEQKLRAEEQTDRDGTYCLTCRSQFGWTLRKYNCRLCGRPYCYYCCSYVVSVQQGGAKERCCKDCFTQHGQDPGSPAPMSSPTRTSTPSSKGELRTPQPDDTVFCIISEDEVSGDSLYTTALSTDSGQTSSGIPTTDDSDELISSVQDAEICLLKSGEMTLSVPYSMEDVVWLGDESRELFIKSSCYSVILITADHPGPSISWTFSSKPKSISFSVVYRENTDTPLEQAKVLIPLTRCNSHKETIQGQLKVRNPGEFTFIFDNSFSRFVSKKVLYKLSIGTADVCNGSDSP